METTIPQRNNPKQGDLDKEFGYYQVCVVGELSGDKFQLFVDTACAKSVVSMSWAVQVTNILKTNGVEPIWTQEREPFRFGPHNTIHSEWACILPLQWGPNSLSIRFSVVDRDIPPLVAKRVMKFLKGQFGL